MQDLSSGVNFRPEDHHLGAGMSSDPILAQIATLCANAFADVCAIYLRAPHTQPIAFIANDPERARPLEELPYDESYAEHALRHGVQSVVTEPLVVADRTIGTLVLCSYKLDRTVDPLVVTILSSLAATAIDQSRQLLHHYHISNRLQRALLPSRLASVDGLTLDAAYRPADQQTEVGGDWYDAFEIGNGLIGVSVGDVAGHGLDAAVAMSEIRRAIRNVASTTSSPSAWLNDVDDIITSQGLGMATAIAGVYDPRTSVFRYASAGHPHPVLLGADGRAVMLPGGGLLLGLGMSPASHDWTVTLGPGCTCVLYTDGLLEYGHNVLEGERALLCAIELLARDGDPSAGELLHYIFDGASNTDDVATLMLRRCTTTIHAVPKFKYSAVPLSATLCREALRQLFTREGLSGDALFDILTAIGEAVANAIEHGSHEPGETFDVEVEFGTRDIRATIRSRGHWRTFTQSEERGRGLPIMRALSRGVKVGSIQDQTTIALTFPRT